MFKWIKKHRQQKRWAKFARYWNTLNPTITQIIESSRSEDCGFKWNQLVVQEIRMWIQLDKQVEPDDFSYICKTRGLDNTMRTFLYLALQHIGLIDHSQDYEIIS